MARPKKLTDADAVRLVDSLYEQSGDYRRLKFSELEKHAALLGLAVRAYDLRRNEVVLNRIAEIEALELNSGNLESLSYKGLDIDGFICANRTQDKLKRSLAELDGRWRKLYDHAVGLSKKASILSDDLRKSEGQVNSLKAKNAELSEQASAGQKSAAALKNENAYLRKMIREYLYPSLADSILQSGYAGGHTVATQAAIDAMADGDTPSSFSESVAADRELRPREDVLLEKLRLQVLEGGNDAL